MVIGQSDVVADGIVRELLQSTGNSNGSLQSINFGGANFSEALAVKIGFRPLQGFSTNQGGWDIYLKKKKQSSLACEAPEEEFSGPEPSVEEILMSSEVLARTAKKVRQLPRSDAGILSLKYFYHYQDKEISRMLNLTPENSLTRLHRAGEGLLKLLAQEQGRQIISKGEPIMTQVKEKMLEILFEYAAACHVESIMLIIRLRAVLILNFSILFLSNNKGTFQVPVVWLIIWKGGSG